MHRYQNKKDILENSLYKNTRIRDDIRRKYKQRYKNKRYNKDVRIIIVEQKIQNKKMIFENS